MAGPSLALSPTSTSGPQDAARLRPVLVPLLAGILAFIPYLLTLAPDLTWANFGGDGGEIITAAVTLGIPHPPGYPTYVLFGKLLSLLPLPGSMALRFNLFSALSMATAVAFAAAACRDLLGSSWRAALAALAAALSLAFAPLVWSQALITEVYALNLAFLAAFLWSLFRNRRPWLSGILLGFALTTHLTSLLMLPLVPALTPRQEWPRFAAGTALGLLPLLLLPSFATFNSPVIWGDPTTLPGWWWLISGRLYAPNLRLPESAVLSASTLDLLQTLLRQWLWIGWLFVLLGLITGPLTRSQRLWLPLTAVFYIIFTFLNQTEDAAVLLLPALLLLSPLLGAGLQLTGPLAPLLPAALLLTGFATQDLRHPSPVRPLALNTFAVAPPSALLLTPGDPSIFALWYFQHVEGLRSDLALVDANLLGFDWYRARLSARYPEMRSLETYDLEQFRSLNTPQRPFCEVPPRLDGALICIMPPAATPAPDT
jgi:hypothetical protein